MIQHAWRCRWSNLEGRCNKIHGSLPMYLATRGKELHPLPLFGFSLSPGAAAHASNPLNGDQMSACITKGDCDPPSHRRSTCAAPPHRSASGATPSWVDGRTGTRRTQQHPQLIARERAVIPPARTRNTGDEAISASRVLEQF